VWQTYNIKAVLKEIRREGVDWFYVFVVTEYVRVLVKRVNFFSKCRIADDILKRLVTIVISHRGPKSLIFSRYRNFFPDSKVIGARILPLNTI